ncbi:MAG: hypothetical protein MRJ65_02760 [Candidatus Brocadiaceae bacterium]|nr:hypothetical protein [Candidatus Brocadiaceae bacterium]
MGKWIRFSLDKSRFIDTCKSKFMTGMAVLLSFKIGLLILATFATMFLLFPAMTQCFPDEMSRRDVIIFTSPLTLVLVAKLYFIFYMLLSCRQSREFVQPVFSGVLLKGKQCLRRVVESLSFEEPLLYPNKLKNR